MENGVFFSFKLSISVYLYWEDEKKRLRVWVMLRLRNHRGQNMKKICHNFFISSSIWIKFATPMGNSVFFSFVLSLSIYLYWEYEKNDIECEFSTYLQHHKIQNLCGHTSMIIHVCSYWHLSYKMWNHDSSNRFTIYGINLKKNFIWSIFLMTIFLYTNAEHRAPGLLIKPMCFWKKPITDVVALSIAFSIAYVHFCVTYLIDYQLVFKVDCMQL